MYSLYNVGSQQTSSMFFPQKPSKTSRVLSPLVLNKLWCKSTSLQCRSLTHHVRKSRSRYSTIFTSFCRVEPHHTSDPITSQENTTPMIEFDTHCSPEHGRAKRSAVGWPAHSWGSTSIATCPPVRRVTRHLWPVTIPTKIVTCGSHVTLFPKSFTIFFGVRQLTITNVRCNNDVQSTQNLTDTACG